VFFAVYKDLSSKEENFARASKKEDPCGKLNKRKLEE